MKGQVALEFSMMVALAFVFFGVILIIALAMIERTSDQRAFVDLEDAAADIRQEILFAATAEEGYQRTFTIPQDLRGREFTLSNTETSFTLTLVDGKTFTRQTPTMIGVLGKGDVTLRKVNGQVMIQ